MRPLRRTASVSAELTVIYWRDIPAQVNAADGAAIARVQLPERFQQAIDAAAMQAGLVDADAYLEHWRQESPSLRAGAPGRGGRRGRPPGGRARPRHARQADPVRRRSRVGAERELGASSAERSRPALAAGPGQLTIIK